MTDLTETQTVGVRDTLIVELLKQLSVYCEDDTSMFTHAAVLYEVARELVGVENEEDVRAQISDVTERIITKINSHGGGTN